MRISLSRLSQCAVALVAVWACLPAQAADKTLRPVTERFAAEDTEEVPSLQRHISPLLGRLGCNGRACHGSFQGRGGFRLSLFGYDFKFDHEQMAVGDNPRVNVADPDESLIIFKPTSEYEHEGGERYKKGSWEHHVIRNWIAGGAKVKDEPEKLQAVEVTPSELLFNMDGEKVQLKVVAVWADGTREDVTPLCRYSSGNEDVATIDENGLVIAGQRGDTHLVVAYDRAVVPVPAIRPVTDLVGPAYPEVATPTKVDELVVDKLRKLGIVPSDLASDEEFLRRVRLDLTGTLPSPREIEEFLADTSPQKRSSKIDELLASDAYAAWWTTRICDWTGNNEGMLVNATPVRGRGGQEWYDWVYKRVADNTPYDELCEGFVVAKSRQGDQDYLEYCKMMSDIARGDSDKSVADLESMPHYWARRNFRTTEERAIGFAYTFLGIRIQCAQCHKHPFDQWSKEDFAAFEGFFGGVNANSRTSSGEDRDAYEKLVKQLGLNGLRGNDLQRKLPELLKKGKTIPFPEVGVQPIRTSRNSSATKIKLLGGDVVDPAKVKDVREPLMEWLRDKNNPYFAKAFVNRVWAAYFNRGIVEPPDDLSLGNPPCNKPLLDYLAEGFINHGFDMKWVHREIANSRTYQLSWRPNETNAGDQVNFSRAIPRRLPAEVAFDAITQATASDKEIAAMHQEIDGRAIALASAGYRNAGRGSSGYALQIFGRSIRESNCDCDRSMEASLLQTVYLQNDNDVFSMLDRRNDGWLSELAGQLSDSPRKGEPAPKKPETKELVKQAYLRTLSRHPNEQELARSMEYINQASDTHSGVRDLLWALLNTKEFIVNH